ncbi:MAG: PucC family protein, partial [Chloroflexi bacterium]|nr:PucC family protein [Chloroflexota bacterium]
FGSLLAGAGALELLFSHNTPLVQFSFFTLTDLHAGGLLIGIGMGFFTSANWAWAIDLAPREQGGKFLGLTNLATAGATVVTSLFGPIISFLNARDAGSGFTLMFFVALIGFFLGAVLLGNVKETAGKKSPIANGK